MKILVAGATGYAGFYAAIALRQARNKVKGLVRDKTKPRAQELREYEVTLAPGDIRDPETYCQRLKESDVVIHAMMDFEFPIVLDKKVFCIAEEQRPKCLDIAKACLQ